MNSNFLIFILVQFFISSCINMSVMEKNGRNYVIEVNNLTVEEVKPVKWRVGKKGRQIVHRGVKVKISLPHFSKSDLSELIQERKVDSVVVAIERVIRGTKIPIGYLNIPIGVKGTLPKSVFFFIDYYAAGIRPSHVKYICPPYGHDYKVSGISINKLKLRKKLMTISSQYETKVKGSGPSRFVYNGQRFVAGKDILGQYYLKLAFYSNREKLLKSEYQKFQDYISVNAHMRNSIKGCPSNTGTGILQDDKKFKWKK